MTIKSAEEMVRMVMRIMDENPDAEGSEVSFGSPAHSLQGRIRELLPAVAEEVVRTAPRAAIDEMLEFTAEAEWLAPGHGVVALPQDFCRLVSFRMSDWKRAVTVAVPYDSPQYQLRFTPTRLRAGVRSAPAVSLVPRSAGIALEFIGSSEPWAYVEYAAYLPIPYDEDADLYRLPRRLVLDVARETARQIGYMAAA